MIDIINIFTLLGVTLLLGYVCSIIFKKTQIPDVIWLLLFGFLIGPILNLVDRTIFISMAPVLAAIALLIILFDAGLEMKLYEVIKEFPRGILLSIIGISLTIISIAVASVFLFNFDWIRAFLLGSIIGGPSSAIVVCTLEKLNIRENVRTLLDLESIFTDPIDVVLTLALIQVYASTISPYSVIGNIVNAFSVGATTGFLVGIIWLFLIKKIKENVNYILTFAILLLVYAFVESLGGSGAIAALVFGIVLGSSEIISKFLRFKKCISIDPSLKKFHEEITFFIKSFFFVTMGIIVSINSNFIIQGIIITFVIAFFRVIAVKISTYGMKLTKFETNLMKVTIPQGLATAVMAYMPLIYGVKDAEVFLNIAFIVIMATIIYTTIGIKILYNRERNENAKPKESL